MTNRARKGKSTAEEKIIRGLRGFADALKNGEDVTERFTCRKVMLNLEPTPYDPELVKVTRDCLGVSQTLFAKFLGVSSKEVQEWEQGRRSVSPIASRFMDEIRNDPKHWRERFLQLASPKASTHPSCT